jgi:NTP pyrophosphatase (non-canonical NTP hydrolase)
MEEVNELEEAIISGDLAEIKDAIGDITVTLVLQAEMNGLDFMDCVQSAHDIISKRKGKMVNGIFVKEVTNE